MRVKTLTDVDFSASVLDIPEGVELEDFGVEVYTQWLEKKSQSNPSPHNDLLGY